MVGNLKNVLIKRPNEHLLSPVITGSQQGYTLSLGKLIFFPFYYYYYYYFLKICLFIGWGEKAHACMSKLEQGSENTKLKANRKTNAEVNK